MVEHNKTVGGETGHVIEYLREHVCTGQTNYTVGMVGIQLKGNRQFEKRYVNLND